MEIKKRILITGGTGLVGSEMSLALLSRGWELVLVGRRSEASFRNEFTLPCTYYEWKDPTVEGPPEKALDVDAVLHLMGEPIADRRWTTEQKKNLRDSRILTTRNLVSALKKHNPKLQTFVSASAIGLYGDCGNQTLTESSPSSNDFLGTLCQEWELEARNAPGRGVQIRTGIVLSNNGGALGKMVPLFEKGLAGKLSTGKQWMSWIHIGDLVRIFLEAIENPKMQGPYNAVAPEPVTNETFTEVLAKRMKVGIFLPVPKLALSLAMGEMAQVVLSSQRIQPQALESLGFAFRFTKLEDALDDLFHWKESCHDRIFKAFQWVPQSKDSIFQFFSDAKKLEILTPDFLHFHVLSKLDLPIQEGTEIDYQLKIHGVPARWKTRIAEWTPGRQFKDIQLQGPYKKWVHTHTFETVAGGTLLQDQVIYQLPLASLGGNIALPLVRGDIQKIFSFRKKKILELFGHPL